MKKTVKGVYELLEDQNAQLRTEIEGVRAAVNQLANNRSIGFVRVRKHKLKSGHPDRATESASFDLVRAVRINGKPRYELVLGLGSLKNYGGKPDLERFWMHALRRMAQYGLNEDQRRYFALEMMSKGARLPEE